MRKFILSVFASIILVSVSGQIQIRTKSYNFSPAMDESFTGIWQEWEREIPKYDTGTSTVFHEGAPDSAYILIPGLPNTGDVSVPDYELKMKTLWNNDTIFFLFQRLDDEYVTGYGTNGSADASVAEGLDNKDATKIYFYFSSDSTRLDSVYNFSDSIAWLQFGWQSDDMEGRFPDGSMTNSWEDYHARCVQWCEGDYCFAKISISLKDIAPFAVETIHNDINKLGYCHIGFTVEATENDKEVEVEGEYVLQTRTFWNADFGYTAYDDVSDWGWLIFLIDEENNYSTSVKSVNYNFANIYPNPAGSHIWINLDEPGEAAYKIFDLTGRQLLSGVLVNSTNELDIQQLATGTYLVSVQKTNGQSLTKKLLVY
ncbi:MAG: T9SS type A sorting domain-containing protein [Bacteroidales bacterium]|nr:T9SS type A sorting domain-containing protein [Bacteroidales bacterium]MBN2819263.1 T9SS type A sorting domain-containing protein [Bacteroidales bacterium]